MIAELCSDPAAKALAQSKEGFPREQSTAVLNWAGPPIVCHGRETPVLGIKRGGGEKKRGKKGKKEKWKKEK